MQQTTTSSEFVEWCHFLAMDVNEFHRNDYYMAQIAAEIRRSNSTKPERIKTSDFILEFDMSPEKEEPEEISPEESLRRKKAYWMAPYGVEY